MEAQGAQHNCASCMRTTGRIAALALTCCLALGGCSKGAQAETPLPLPVSTPAADVSSDSRQFTAALYYPSHDLSGLVVKSKSLMLYSSEQSRALTVLNEFLDVPQDSALLDIYPFGLTIRSFELSQGVAVVDFTSQWNEMDEYERFVARAALANTLTRLAEINYVNILVEGKAARFFGLPGGLMGKTDTRELDLRYLKAMPEGFVESVLTIGEEETASLTDAPAETYENGEERITRRTALYYPDLQKGFLLAEARDIEFASEESYVNTLMSELSAGPTNTALMGAAMQRGINIIRPPVVERRNGRYILNIELPERWFAELKEKSAEEARLGIASIVLTLTSFLPDIDDIRIIVEGQDLSLPEIGGSGESLLFARTQFSKYVGNTISLYFPDSSGRGMRRTLRAASQDTWHQPGTRLKELARGTSSTDDSRLSPAWPWDLLETDWPSVASRSHDSITVNLTENFIAACAALGEAEERLMIYCIVNTLSDMQGVTRIIFTCGGSRIEDWPGLITLESPLVRNPGLIITD